MTAQDIKQLRKLLQEEFAGFRKEEVDPLARAVRALGGIARLVTKDYCEDKQNDLRGDVLANRKKDSARLDAFIKMQYKKGNVTDKEIEILEKMRGFAPLPAEI